ncbi:hypothetical protein [Croceicoccus naphthovorans]|uniref:Uncharacterized protein n=1 Tax=Croceicoccus naphthovorans TaxID=1348774 RepID=A0A0G3XJB8_9SPHN|nr:hypothetical protein [Croceicoccus naphthovorans]AKM11287.1 hypothetical protein AB433_16985 [Croceicoccus naphthovorans]MBB3989792.1 hypothetical protein [Croceicoccus naphthovorans]
MDMQSRRERASAKVGNAPVIPEPRNGRAAKGDARPAAAIPALEKRRLQCYLALMLGDIVAVFASFAFGSLFHPVSFAIQHSLTHR